MFTPNGWTVTVEIEKDTVVTQEMIDVLMADMEQAAQKLLEKIVEDVFQENVQGQSTGIPIGLFNDQSK